MKSVDNFQNGLLEKSADGDEAVAGLALGVEPKGENDAGLLEPQFLSFSGDIS